MAETLASWNDGAAKRAIVDFVERAVSEVPVEERIATFDNDGTLWCEKPMPIQADFILRRLYEMAEADAGAARPPALEGGPRARLRVAGRGDGRALRGRRHERAHARRAASSRRSRGSASRTSRRASDAFLRGVRHPTLGRDYLDCAYTPMVELLGYLEANGFANYIASGGAATSCGRSARSSTASRASG